jgi:tRNA(fMet)-specific endonuclease VapC
VAITHLADTDVCIQILKKKNRPLTKRFLELQDSIAVSNVTVFELFAGAENYDDKPRRCAVIEEFLSLLTVIPLDTDAARRAGEIQGQLSRRGERIGSYDVLNAGIALSRNLVIATNNLREFLRVQNLQVEQWA